MFYFVKRVRFVTRKPVNKVVGAILFIENNKIINEGRKKKRKKNRNLFAVVLFIVTHNKELQVDFANRQTNSK